MQSKKFGNTYFVRLDKGEEIVACLKKFCENEKIKLGHVQGIGASSRVVLKFFDQKTKKYHSREFTGEYEIAPLAGNITTKDNKIWLHLHINISSKDFKAYAGHLEAAIVGPTFECIIEKMNGNVGRRFDKISGLKVWDVEK